jgi:aminoglycoside/choline kinase family phosphotransferase
VAISELLADMGLHVPVAETLDLEQGFLLLNDLGAVQYLSELNGDNVERLYGDAMQALLVMQGSTDARIAQLPPYDQTLLMDEMELFREWLVAKHLGIELSESINQLLDDAFRLLADNAQAQPRGFVHRDYHSRNLMVSSPSPGILDFQDAVYGPITYDLVSLLRDCYIQWPREQVEKWLQQFHQASRDQGLQADYEQYRQWFDWMGVQRHLKASGIFARLNIRDGKPGYLNDIPLTLGYIVQVGADYPQLQPLVHFIENEVLPRFLQKQGAA